jgi:VCBS repeat protein
LGNGDGSFQAAAQSFGAGSYPYSVAVGDFNGDGALDLAVANAFSNNVSLLINNTRR